MSKFRFIIVIFSLLFCFNATAVFQASYDVIFDGNNHPPYVTADTYLDISKIRYSNEGSRIVFFGSYYQNDPWALLDYKAYIIDFDGTNLHEIPLPQRDDGFTGALSVRDLVINDDGSIIYLSTYGTDQFQTGGTYSIPEKLYRIDVTTSPINATVVQIADFVVLHGSQAYAPPLQTTSTGDWVYYVNANNLQNGRKDDVYRLSSTGATFETVVQDVGIQLATPSGCVGQGESVSSNGFSISGDGSKVLFRLNSIYNQVETCMWESYWWVLKTNSGYTLLNPNSEAGYQGGMVSSSGDQIVIVDSSSYFSYDGSGLNELAIEPRSYNYTGPAMTEFGDKYFFKDNNHQSSAVVNTDGSGLLNILPKSTYYTLDIIHIAGMNYSGNQVVFTDGLDRVYAGKLYSGTVGSLAPVVTDITFEPAYIIEGNTNPVIIKVTAQATVGDIEVMKIDNINNGRFIPTTADMSHYFASNPQDNGLGEDDVAGDGIFTEKSSLRYNGDYNNPNKNTVRISAIDTFGNIRVVEKPLNIGIFTNGFELTAFY
ncbi:MAG: hypothetical protein DWP95_06260 [Proteobacteria bacterium]|nr:MAG: hypothetical protein DWP95_06260 [Pseudomonadota bacterium]